jgi:hypothetical protein
MGYGRPTPKTRTASSARRTKGRFINSPAMSRSGEPACPDGLAMPYERLCLLV